MNLRQLAEQICIALSNQPCNNPNVIVRDREIFIDATAPTGHHSVDFDHPGFRKIEISVRLI